MFGFFKAKTFEDPQLGAFTRKGGKWRGRITLPTHGEKSLHLAGGSDAPDADALSAARALPSLFPALLPEIQKDLFEHYEPYAEADAAAVKIANDATLWNHVRLLGVTVERMDGKMTIEIALATDWDEEHTLGAIVQDGKVAGLNGSILCGF